jgi:Fis family transcriptional regulator, factor for inversion stimulation protein
MDNVIDYVHHETAQTTSVTSPTAVVDQPIVQEGVPEQEEASLRDTVRFHLEKYIHQLGEDAPKYLYKEMLKLIEKPMLVGIMKYTRSNQSLAAKLLNISRGTLRKKLKIYDLL